MLLIHGIEDDTVPFTATAEAARILRSCGVRHCDEVYLGRTSHQDTVMHLMLGGKTLEHVVAWISELDDKASHPVASNRVSTKTALLATSRL